MADVEVEVRGTTWVGSVVGVGLAFGLATVVGVVVPWAGEVVPVEWPPAAVVEVAEAAFVRLGDDRLDPA